MDLHLGALEGLYRFSSARLTGLSSFLLVLTSSPTFSRSSSSFWLVGLCGFCRSGLAPTHHKRYSLSLGTSCLPGLSRKRNRDPPIL